MEANPEPTLWRRPSMVALSRLIVLAPFPVFMLAAANTEQDVIAFAAVPISVLLAWWMLALRGEGWSDLGIRQPNPYWRLIAVVVVATFVLVAAGTGLRSLLRDLTGWDVDTSRFDVLRGNLPALVFGLLLVWTTAAFGEEMVFRGFVMHSLHRLLRDVANNRWAWTFALLVTGLIFGVGHAYQGIAGGILTGVFGVVFGLAYFAGRRNLWSSIITHGVYDTIGFVVVYHSWDLLAESPAIIC